MVIQGVKYVSCVTTIALNVQAQLLIVLHAKQVVSTNPISLPPTPPASSPALPTMSQSLQPTPVINVLTPTVIYAKKPMSRYVWHAQQVYTSSMALATPNVPMVTMRTLLIAAFVIHHVLCVMAIPHHVPLAQLETISIWTPAELVRVGSSRTKPLECVGIAQSTVSQRPLACPLLLRTCWQSSSSFLKMWISLRSPTSRCRTSPRMTVPSGGASSTSSTKS